MKIIPVKEFYDIKKQKKINYRCFSLFSEIILFIGIIIFLLFSFKHISFLSIKNEKIKKKKIDTSFNKIMVKHKLKILSRQEIISQQKRLEYESKLLHLSTINKKRTFEKRFPLPSNINCYEHMREGGLQDLMAFTSFLTKDTIFFEFGSGCTSIIAKYYSKKSYSIEGNKKWYELGIKNGLKGNIILKDIKPDGKGNLWSTPGKKSNIKNWKNYFQAYKKEYNADVIFIDGRFRVACAFDIFSKIKDDTIILIHEYYRSPYFVIEKYYDYIYHWGTLFMFKKKSNISKIPLNIQKKFWKDST